MRRPIFLYTLWCAGVAALFFFANAQAWSPFASGRAAPRGGFGGGGGFIFVGPTHK
jgi:hypothetical protein